TQGLLAIGHGDSSSARRHADDARRHAAHDPLAMLLHAQSAQLDGDREGAQRAFRAMAEREDTRLLGLRGLFIEAQRADDPVAAVMGAEEALRLSPSSSWASHAVLGFCCAKGDWAGALKILDNNQSAGLIDKATYRRHRGVLLTAHALELENAGSHRGRAGDGARRGRRIRVYKGARGAGALHRRAYAARRAVDGGDRAHRTWRQRPGTGVDLACRARAARSGLDRGRLCQ